MKFSWLWVFSLISFVLTDEEVYQWHGKKNLDSYTTPYGIYRRHELMVISCIDYVAATAFYFEPTKVDGYCDVNLQQSLGTMATCLKMTNSTGTIKRFVKDCHRRGALDLTVDDVEAAYKNASKHLTNVTADPSFNLTELYYKPALLKQATVDLYIDSVCNRFQNYNFGTFFGIALQCYWYAIILLSGFWHLLKFIAPSFIKKFTGPFFNRLRSNFTLAATFGKHHNNEYKFLKFIPMLIPTRMESLMVTGWVIMALIFCCTNYERQDPNAIWKDIAGEMGRKVSDRTATIAMWLMPMLVLFAGRNNFLQWFTGWNYSRFITVHKWIARTLCLIAMVHGITMNISGKALGKYELRNAEAYVRWGYVALVAWFTMSFFAMQSFKRNKYELFVLGHIILAAISIAGVWLHIDTLKMIEFVYATIAIWCFDRFIRIVRIVAFGVRTATVELKAAETLKVTVTRPSYWKAHPGSHAFVYFYRPTMFWQSHPFTIVDKTEEGNKITFFVKIKGGFSHGLYQYLSKQPGQRANIKIGVEGPYGKALPLSRYDNNVFISSGNGVPGLYAEAKDLLIKKPEAPIKFIWIIRHYKTIEWFYEELLKLKNPNIDLDIYITNGSLGINPFWNDSETEVESDINKDKEKTQRSDEIIDELKLKLSHCNVIEARPDISVLVGQLLAESNGTTALSCCCHASIDDLVRKAVADNLNSTPHRVDLFDQNQAW